MHRHDHSGGVSASRVRAAASLLLGVHLLVVGWLMLRPRSVAWVAPANLRPFTTIRADLAAGPQAALEAIGGGLLLLAPLGVLLPLVAGRLHRPLPGTAARTVLGGVLASLALAVVRSGVPELIVDVDAVMLNAAGVALAHVLFYPLLRARLRRVVEPPPHAGRRTEEIRVELREEAPQGRTPRAPRVGIAP
ncbi:VanZ family protein [Streptomyces sp. JJ36]|uniref:VanZ family protein n=1 Tax=Streptomyces sp. JJ36 TaxID=2736645 RepID=UPI001F3901BD|nr:VanZ family protein [Streptomyces sp. JJ36]